MADNIFRTTRRNPAPQGGQQGDDPLAELARLIGRTNPQSRAARQNEPPPLDAPEATPEWPADARYAEPQQPPSAEPQPRYAEPQARHDQAQDQPSDQYAAQSPDQYDDQYDDRQYDDRRQAPQPANTYPPYRAAPPSYNAEHEQPDPYAARSQRDAAQDDDAQAYDDQASYQDHPRYDDAHDPIQDLPAFLPRGRDARRDNRRDDRGDDYAEEGQREDDQSYELEDYEDDEAPPRKRRGFAIFAALLGLMVLGTAGAFSYRAMFGGSMLPSLPPIIKADGTPNKIVPAGGAANASGQASEQCRFARQAGVARREAGRCAGAGEYAAGGFDHSGFPGSQCRIAVVHDGSGPIRAGQNMPGSIAPASAGAASVPMQLGPAGAAPMQGAMRPRRAGGRLGAPVAGTSGTKKVHTVAIHAGQPDSADAAPPRRLRPAAPRPPAGRAATPTGRQCPAVDRSLARRHGGAGSAEIPRTRTALARPAAPERRRSLRLPRPAAAIRCKCRRSGARLRRSRPIAGCRPNIRPSSAATRRPFARSILATRASSTAPWSAPTPRSEEAAQMCTSLKAAGGSCIVQRN